uniref:Uncharacterized protein n=1 Tax=Sphaerodactylus townsendi TaxID=933632 RepID=A0ACB8FQM6_9SAUR
MIEEYEIWKSPSCLGHQQTVVECHTKTKAMRHDFKRVQQHQKYRATCLYYEELERILGGDESIQPCCVVRSYTLPAAQASRQLTRQETSPLVQDDSFQEPTAASNPAKEPSSPSETGEVAG